MKLTDLTQPFRLGRRSENNQGDDLGFGTKIIAEGERLINPDGSFNIVRKGKRAWTPYLELVEMSWRRFFLLVFLSYGLLNAFFAMFFVMAGPEALTGLEAGAGMWQRFMHAFFFSVQTFTTVGYGSTSPQGMFSNVVASIDALVGLLSFALITGLFFARFSKPKSQLLFSRSAIITPYFDGQEGKQITSLQFRIANGRNNRIINILARMVITWLEDGEKGGKVRRFRALELERDQVALLPLNWTIVHPIREDSPLYGLDRSEITRAQVEVLILLEGYDETFAQNVHANGSYTCREIQWDVRFAPMYHSNGGRTVLELDRLSETIPL